MRKNSNHLFLNFILLFVGFSIPMTVIYSVLSLSIRRGIFLGVGSGLVFATLLIIFMMGVIARRDDLKHRYGIYETALYEGGATYVVDKNTAIGGFLYLFENQLCFLPHIFNIDWQKIMIPYEDMVRIDRGKKVRTIVLYTTDGMCREFYVNEAKEWIEIIQEKIDAKDAVVIEQW